MRYANSKIKMKDSSSHYAVEYPDRVRDLVQAKRVTKELVELESTAIPTGQKFYIDPHEVQAIERVE